MRFLGPGSRRERMELQNKQEGDRISDLPEPIIHRILSLLDTKTAARTSAFSETWQCVWTSLHSFVFDEMDFDAEGTECLSFTPGINQKFRRKK